MKQSEFAIVNKALIIQAGPDTLNYLNISGQIPDNMSWMVYFYTTFNYEGSGEVIMAFQDGTFSFGRLESDQAYASNGSLSSKISISGITPKSKEQIKTLINKSPSGQLLNPEEWGDVAYCAIWRTVQELNLLSSLKEVAKVLLNSPFKEVREYAICYILPAIKQETGNIPTRSVI